MTGPPAATGAAAGDPARGGGAVVRRLFESMQARDWDAAAACVADDVVVAWPASGETFRGEAFVAMNRAYPEGWRLEVAETLDEPPRVAARVRVDHDGEVFWCAGFHTVTHGLVREGVEYWTTQDSEQPPAWRARFAAPDAP